MEHDYAEMELLLRLKRCFDACYEKYMGEAFGMSNEQTFENVSEVVAVKEVYVEMSFWIELSLGNINRSDDVADKPSVASSAAPISKTEALWLLSLENPLKELADKWWFYTLANKADFQYFFRHRLFLKDNSMQKEVNTQ